MEKYEIIICDKCHRISARSEFRWFNSCFHTGGHEISLVRRGEKEMTEQFRNCEFYGKIRI